MLPQLGGVHAVQVPPVQVVLPMQLPHCTLPLPHAFSIDPHFDPAPPSPPMHSGGGGLHTPPTHSCPEGHVHWAVWPHPSPMVPQSTSPGGVQLRVPQPLPPPSEGGWVTHWLFTHVSPAAHPPQVMGTPHGSTPISPHWPVHETVWHD
jgi:hypothetical protein